MLQRATEDKRFRYLRRLPSPDLSVFIEHYWMVHWDLRGAAPYTAQTVSHPSVHMVIEHGDSKIHGVIKGRSSRVLKGEGRVFAVKFRPGGFYPFLKSPLSRLTNRSMTLGDVFGTWGKKFERAILSLEDDNQRVTEAECWLRERLPERDEAAVLAGQIVDEICLNREIMTVDHVAACFNLGKRALQRMFDQYIGVTPKWVIRIYRLHELMERLHEDKDARKSVNFANLAQELGYFDQAHFVKDFKSIVGHTPSGYLRQLRRRP